MPQPLSYLSDQLNEWRQAGTYQRLRVLESEAAAMSRFDGKEVINLASNNYLGLTTHPKLREAALEAVRRYGVGSGAVRTISGTMKLHMELEERIAAVQERGSLRWYFSPVSPPTPAPFPPFSRPKITSFPTS